MHNNKKFLATLFILSLIMRALLFMYFTRHGSNAWVYVDSDQYDAVATHFMAGDGFSLNGSDAQYYRLPGYPFFLAACYAIVPNVKAALFIQIIISSIIPILIFYLSLTLFPYHLFVAQFVGLLSSVHLGFVLYSGMLATESLSVLFLLLFFIFFFRLLRSHDYVLHDAVCAGISLGIASLIRPVGHYVLIVSLMLMLVANCRWFRRLLSICARPEERTPWASRRIRAHEWFETLVAGLLTPHHERKQIGIQRVKKRSLRIFSLLLLAGSWLIVVTPWLLRNFLLTGSLFFHSLPGLHFMQYTAANIVMQQEGYSYSVARTHVLDEWHKKINEQELSLGRHLNDYECCVVGEKLALSYVVHHPFFAARHMLGEMFKTCAGLYSAIILLADGVPWPDYGPGVTLKQKIQRFLRPSVRRPLLVGYIYFEIICMIFLLLGCGIFCIRALYDTQVRAALLCMAPYCILFVTLTLAYGGARLRMPIEPFMIIAAMYGFFGGRLHGTESNFLKK